MLTGIAATVAAGGMMIAFVVGTFRLMTMASDPDVGGVNVPIVNGEWECPGCGSVNSEDYTYCGECVTARGSA